MNYNVFLISAETNNPENFYDISPSFVPSTLEHSDASLLRRRLLTRFQGFVIEFLPTWIVGRVEFPEPDSFFLFLLSSQLLFPDTLGFPPTFPFLFIRKSQ